MSSQNSESSEINSSISKVNCDILRDVYKILVDGNVLNTKTSDMIVDFKFPSELMVGWFYFSCCSAKIINKNFPNP